MNKTMKAVVVTEPGKVAVMDVPMVEFGEYGDYECLIRVTACGFCSSTDIKIIDNAMADLDIQYPTVLGHECVGVIEKVGAKVRNYKVGDRVTCGRGTHFKKDKFSSTFGQMAQYAGCHDVRAMAEDGIDLQVAIPSRQPTDFVTYPTRMMPEGMSDIDAVMILSFEENYSALLNFGIKAGMDLLIFGDGTVARGLAFFARHMGVNRIVCVGHHDDKLEEIVKQASVDQTVNTSTQSLEESLKGQAFDGVIDAVGSMSVIHQGTPYLKNGGKMCVYGVHKRKKANLNLFDLPSNTCLHVLPWPYQEHRVHDEVVELIKSGKLNPKDYYSQVLPMNQIEEVVRLIRTRQAHKIILDMREE